MPVEGHRPRAAVWTLAAAMTGFVSAGLFSSLLQLSRGAFVAVHGLVVAAFLTCCLMLTRADVLAETGRHWRRGLLVGLALGLVLLYGVKTQPGSATPSGAALALGIAWFGLVYGMADAVLLNILPTHIVFTSRRDRPTGALARSALAFAASLFVTAAYHLGFAEFRGPTLFQPLLGNAIATAGYLASGSPLASIVAHVIMHVAAVLHGMETTAQLPPHY